MIDEDPDLLADCAAAVLARNDPDSWQHTVDALWHHVRPVGHRRRHQGWKLHVPATPLSAGLVLHRSVTVLAIHRCAFKFPKSMRQLHQLIGPNADRASAGKFLTVYPNDDDHARRVAEDLHEATLGLPGQWILTDRRYRPHSQVYYRYGAFTPDIALNNEGEYRAVLRDGAGERVSDQREVGRPAPDWATDPFRAGDDAAREPVRVPESILVGDRFQVRTAIRQNNRGGVYLAIDTTTGTEVVLKRFRRHTAAAVDGSDSRHRARAEAKLMDLLGPSGAAPRFIQIFTADGDMFVAEERIEGVPLRKFVLREVRPTPTGVLALDPELALDLATQLVDLIAKVHEAGYVLGDVTPNNVMVTADRRLVLIDLESAARPGEVAPRLLTRGYAPPEEEHRARLVSQVPEFTADLYGLGAMLVFLASGAHPPACPGTRLRDMVELMAHRNPVVAELWPVITGLLAADPAARPGLTAVRAALGGPRPPAPVLAPRPDADELIDDMLAEITTRIRPEASWLWRTSDVGSRYDPCAAHVGAPGVLAVLNQALRAGRGTAVAATMDTAARWIVRRLPEEPKVLPGLMFGRAGTAMILAETGALLDEADLRAAGPRLAARLPTAWPVPDVFHGVAGAGLALLALWRSTGDSALLDRALRCADGLLAAAHTDADHITWTATGDFLLAGKSHWGFAHGVAGIGTFLLDAAVATGDDRYLDIAWRCARSLATVADRVDDAAFWPSGEPDENADSVRLTGFCSGSNGVGTFLLRFFSATGDSMAGELAAAAAVAVRCANWTAPPVWCHGLASDGDFLLDCAEVLGEPRYRAWADEVAEIIATRAVPRNGRRLTPDDGTDVVASLGNGFAGVLSFLLRLRHGGNRLLLGPRPTRVREDTRQFSAPGGR